MIKKEVIMEVYSVTLEYFINLFSSISMHVISNYEISILLLSMLVILISAFVFNRKIIKLEKTQFNDIDDITSYSRLIDDELGILRKQQDELNQVINSSEVKITSNAGSAKEGKLFTNTPYSQAVQLARRGYAREDIISLCSLTDSEAELILALHSNTEAA